MDNGLLTAKINACKYLYQLMLKYKNIIASPLFTDVDKELYKIELYEIEECYNTFDTNIRLLIELTGGNYES